MSTAMDSEDNSLLEVLDSLQVNCLNESDEHPLSSILAAKARNTASDKYLLSDADEQLLLNIPFNQSVRVKSISLKSNSVAQAPKLIKLFTNQPALGFEDVEDADESAAAQIIELSEEDVTTGKTIPLRFVRFQKVNSLHIFVASNQGGEDETRIDALDILGIPEGATKSLSELKKQEE